MKVSDVKTVYELMKDATHVQIIWLGFLIAPFAVTAWFDLFDKVEFLSKHKLFTLLAIFVTFLIMLIVALAFDSRDKKKKLLLAKINGYMGAHSYRIVRFSTIRTQFSITETDEQLLAVINTFPDKLCLAKVKKKNSSGEEIKDENGESIVENAFRIVA